MIKYSKVYRNQSTIIPIDIANKINIKEENVAKWTINKKNEEITIELLFKENINKNYLDRVIKTEDNILIYRNISQKRHIILPVEVEQVLKFDLKSNLLKWTLEKNKIKIDKITKNDLLNISGILQDNKVIK